MGKLRSYTNTFTHQKHSNAQKVSLLGIVLAIRIVLSFIPGINLGNVVQMGFGFLGGILTGVLFGPVYAIFISVANDLIGTMFSSSGVFFIGFTASAGVGGLIYSSILWRKPLSWKRIFVAVLLVTLIVNIGMNSIWIRIMYDRAWAVFFPIRVIKNIISLPLNTIVATLLFTQPRVKTILRKFQI